MICRWDSKKNSISNGSPNRRKKTCCCVICWPHYFSLSIIHWFNSCIFISSFLSLVHFSLRYEQLLLLFSSFLLSLHNYLTDTQRIQRAVIDLINSFKYLEIFLLMFTVYSWSTDCYIRDAATVVVILLIDWYPIDSPIFLIIFNLLLISIVDKSFLFCPLVHVPIMLQPHLLWMIYTSGKTIKIFESVFISKHSKGGGGGKGLSMGWLSSLWCFFIPVLISYCCLIFRLLRVLNGLVDYGIHSSIISSPWAFPSNRLIQSKQGSRIVYQRQSKAEIWR